MRTPKCARVSNVTAPTNIYTKANNSPWIRSRTDGSVPHPHIFGIAISLIVSIMQGERPASVVAGNLRGCARITDLRPLSRCLPKHTCIRYTTQIQRAKQTYHYRGRTVDASALSWWSGIEKPIRIRIRPRSGHRREDRNMLFFGCSTIHWLVPNIYPTADSVSLVRFDKIQ